jgi:KipI family sensor histidine kinase inhibitor
MQPKAAAAGDRALLVELGAGVSAGELHAAAASVRARPDVLACIVGHSSLYVIFSSECADAIGAFEIDRKAATALPHSEGVFEVSFAGEYGPDLAEFLAHVRVGRDEFLRRVDGLKLTARYLGFRAGFAYLDGWPAEWAMPRRPTSRPVARGSFAIAGAMAGFYPIDSPGGWNVLGRTGAPLAHGLRAGDTIVIRPTLDRVAMSEEPRDEPLRIDGASFSSPLARVVAAANYANLERALPPGGPFDQVAAALANRAVGNRDDAPILECAMVGPRVSFRDRRVVAWFGAESELPHEQPFVVDAGSELTIGRIRNGLRGYLAVGGVQGVVAKIERRDRNVIRVRRGPHESPIGTVECEVTPQLDRVGIRLRPLQPLGVAALADLPSCGMQCGTIQLHPDGSLVAMGPDHPVTGGYLQPLTVLWDERWKLAQLSPGERVTLLAV